MANVNELLLKVRQGDEDAFAEIVALYTPMLQALACKRSVDFDEVF